MYKTKLVSNVYSTIWEQNRTIQQWIKDDLAIKQNESREK